MNIGRISIVLMLVSALILSQTYSANATLTKEEQAKNKLELEKARIKAKENANPPRPVTDQYHKIKIIAIQLSNTCLTQLKNNHTTNCPAYEDLIQFDTTTPSYSGHFITKNGHLYRDSKAVKSDTHYLNAKDFIICVDCKHSGIFRYQQINIVPTLTLYKNDNDKKIVNNTIISYHLRGVQGCKVATIEYSEFLLKDTIDYLKSGCTVTNFDEKIVDERPYTKHDISTTKAYKHQKWLEEAKKLSKINCLKSKEC